MPIVDGKYEAQIMTYYKTLDEGLEDIRRKLKKARKVRISNVPEKVVRGLMPLLQDKDLAVILPDGARPWKELEDISDIAETKARIFVDYMGTEANVGNISMSDISFSVIWTGGDLLAITAMNYSACVKCQRKTFDMSWRYSTKVSKQK
jgi:hypothetical protein